MMAATMNNSTAEDKAAAEFAATLGETLDFLAEPERQAPVPPERHKADPLASRLAALDAISAWARDYYPERRHQPPEAMTTLTHADMIILFQQTASMQAHLALVDQREIRDRLQHIKGSDLVAAINESWARHGGWLPNVPTVPT
jgi:hypothetical protein